MLKTEFFEAAVDLGFYGVERSGLNGKKDNVRKYWEDMAIKMWMKPSLEKLLNTKPSIRIVDLGSGSGEGFELLRHVPTASPKSKSTEQFLLTADNVSLYYGLDVSPAMIRQGKENNRNRPNVVFAECDLQEGFPLKSEDPFDVYFSSYGSLSHLSKEDLCRLTSEIISHSRPGGVIVFDMYGRYSPEWPGYWQGDCSMMNRYTMGYLFPPEKQSRETAEWFDVTFWSAAELRNVIIKAAESSGRSINSIELHDRSILVGRHMDTAYFKDERCAARAAANRMFDRDHMEDPISMRFNSAYLDASYGNLHEVRERINDYVHMWNAVMELVSALIEGNKLHVEKVIEWSAVRTALHEELKMLAWLYNNLERFPVVDAWASIMSPQIACVLRNLEWSYPNGIGCGHGLWASVQVGE